MASNTSLTKKRCKKRHLRTFDHEKHMSVVLAVSPIRENLDPLVILKGKTDRLIEDLVIPEGACACLNLKKTKDR